MTEADILLPGEYGERTFEDIKRDVSESISATLEGIKEGWKEHGPHEVASQFARVAVWIVPFAMAVTATRLLSNGGNKTNLLDPIGVGKGPLNGALITAGEKLFPQALTNIHVSVGNHQFGIDDGLLGALRNIPTQWFVLSAPFASFAAGSAIHARLDTALQMKDASTREKIDHVLDGLPRQLAEKVTSAFVGASMLATGAALTNHYGGPDFTSGKRFVAEEVFNGTFFNLYLHLSERVNTAIHNRIDRLQGKEIDDSHKKSFGEKIGDFVRDQAMIMGAFALYVPARNRLFTGQPIGTSKVDYDPSRPTWGNAYVRDGDFKKSWSNMTWKVTYPSYMCFPPVVTFLALGKKIEDNIKETIKSHGIDVHRPTFQDFRDNGIKAAFDWVHVKDQQQAQAHG